MTFRKSIAGFVVAIASLVLVSLNATPSCAQSEADDANATAPLYKTISIKPTKFGIHDDKGFGVEADRGAKFTPDKVTVMNSTAQEIIRQAYNVTEDQIVGAPGWLNSPRYDIDAKVNTSALGRGELEEVGSILKPLLSDRFKLAVHRETRLIPVYELLIAGDGPKLRESDPNRPDPAIRVIQAESGRIMGREVPIATLARLLSDQLGRPVLDNTKLSAHYDVTLQWPTAAESSESAILTSIQEQLGLKLVPQLMPKEFLVIDHVEMPSAE